MSKNGFKRCFPARLRLARHGQNLSQTQLAKKIGVTKDWIQHFEGGRRLPSAYILYRLIQLFGQFI
jgi:transcriptional regulator with XRE-family HTH domain